MATETEHLTYEQKLALRGLEMARLFILYGGSPNIKLESWGKKTRREALKTLRDTRAPQPAQPAPAANSELREGILSKLKPYKGTTEGKVIYAFPEADETVVREEIEKLIRDGVARRSRQGMLWKMAA